MMNSNDRFGFNIYNIMGKKIIIYAMPLLFLAIGCTKTVDLSDPGADGARHAAEYFYDLLGRGQAREYVNNMQEAEAMDSSKYCQFMDMMEQYLHEERQMRGGILSAKTTRDTLADTVALVFMDVQFADSTAEEIMLPLVYTRGRWWIR